MDPIILSPIPPRNDYRRRAERADFNELPRYTDAPANLPRQFEVIKMQRFNNRRYYPDNCAIIWD